MQPVSAINTLSELLFILQNNSLGTTTEETFESLQNLLGNEIRIRYEITDPENRTDAHEKGRRFAHLNTLNIARVLLTTDRNHADFSRQLHSQCNGVVLEYPSWKVLSLPAKMFNPKFKLSEVCKNIYNYHIYDIKDGTTVTLYWYNSKGWCLSSTNGFDVSNYQWMGDITYMEALSSLFKIYPEFSLDKLNKNKAYTVGFRHSSFHPLLRDLPKIWFIQSCDLEQINQNHVITVNTEENIGFPIQTRTNLPQTDIKEWILQKNSSSIEDYINTLKSSDPAIHYGFVLRSCVNGNDVILESILLKKIRNIMYNLPKYQYKGATKINPSNRLEYTILRSYLSVNNKYIFLSLFPQFTNKYSWYDNIFDKLSKRIITILRNRNPRQEVNRGKKTIAQRIDYLALSMSEYIRQRNINVMDPSGPGIIMDFLMDKKHLDLYYSCLIV